MSQYSCQHSSGGSDDIKPCHLLTPFQRKLLQKSLQIEFRLEYRVRIEIMLLADEGKSQAEICKALGCSPGMARYWIVMAKAGEAHNWKEQPIGRPKSVNDEYLERLRELVSHSPRDYGYAFGRWTGQWLSKHLAKEFQIEVCDRHINRLLKQMGLSTRPKPADTEEANQPSTNTGIVIRDLTEASASESSVSLWTFNSIG
jgi:transposase